MSSALSDSVLLLNSTLFEKLNVSLDGLSQHFNSLQVLTNFSSMMGPSDPTRPGQLAYKEGLRPKHPVFIIPGALAGQWDVECMPVTAQCQMPVLQSCQSAAMPQPRVMFGSLDLQPGTAHDSCGRCMRLQSSFTLQRHGSHILQSNHAHTWTGFVTSGLELWQGRPCAAGYFRQNLWGTLTMAQTMIADKDCWLQHMMLVRAAAVAAQAYFSNICG